MSIYLVKRKGWRYDFILSGIRYSEAGFKNKREARQAEARKREELTNPVQHIESAVIPTDMAFMDLVNSRLDYVKEYNSDRYYTDHVYTAKKWVRHWRKLNCSQITPMMIQDYLLKRSKQTSKYTANKDLRNLRAMFNFGMHPVREWIEKNPTRGIAFFPVEKRIRYVPPKEDVLKVILAAEAETRDYLWTISLTLGRMGEINRLTWEDINLKDRFVILYTRKKRGGHLTPRKVPMTEKLHEVLSNRFSKRDKRKPWIFWHRYWDRKTKEWAGRTNNFKGLWHYAVNPFCFGVGLVWDFF